MPSLRPPHGRVRGFTLLEVLVALVIVGVALAASMRGALTLTGNADDTRQALLASMAAQNLLLELRLARSQLAIGQTEVPCAQANVEFACEQTIKSTPNPFFRRVELRVFRGTDEAGGGRRRYVELMAVLPTNQ